MVRRHAGVASLLDVGYHRLMHRLWDVGVMIFDVTTVTAEVCTTL